MALVDFQVIRQDGMSAKIQFELDSYSEATFINIAQGSSPAPSKTGARWDELEEGVYPSFFGSSMEAFLSDGIFCRGSNANNDGWVCVREPGTYTITIEGWESVEDDLDELVFTQSIEITFSGGLVWQEESISSDGSGWREVIWVADLGLLVAVAQSGDDNKRVATSPDGKNWTLRNSPTSSWRAVCWSPELELLVAVGDTATSGHEGNGRVMTSPNGIDWTMRDAASARGWFDVEWSPALGLFAAIAQSGNSNRVMTSPNGVDWTERTVSASHDWQRIVWSPEEEIFCSVARNGFNPNDKSMTSSNGVDWTVHTTGVSAEWRDVCWAPDREEFFAVARGANPITVKGMSSANGESWTSAPLPQNSCHWEGVIRADDLELYLAVGLRYAGNEATPYLAYSYDGTDWVPSLQPSDGVSYQSVCWAKEIGLLVAVTNHGTSVTTNQVLLAYPRILSNLVITPKAGGADATVDDAGALPGRLYHATWSQADETTYGAPMAADIRGEALEDPHDWDGTFIDGGVQDITETGEQAFEIDTGEAEGPFVTGVSRAESDIGPLSEVLSEEWEAIAETDYTDAWEFGQSESNGLSLNLVAGYSVAFEPGLSESNGLELEIITGYSAAFVPGFSESVGREWGEISGDNIPYSEDFVPGFSESQGLEWSLSAGFVDVVIPGHSESNGLELETIHGYVPAWETGEAEGSGRNWALIAGDQVPYISPWGVGYSAANGVDLGLITGYVFSWEPGVSDSAGLSLAPVYGYVAAVTPGLSESAGRNWGLISGAAVPYVASFVPGFSESQGLEWGLFAGGYRQALDPGFAASRGRVLGITQGYVTDYAQGLGSGAGRDWRLFTGDILGIVYRPGSRDLSPVYSTIEITTQEQQT